MKKLNIITALLTMLIVLMGCKKECTFVYSKWTQCSNNIQTRTYTSSPSGCTGTPPADSLQRPCVILPTVQIGKQTWTIKNLDTANYRNGDPIPQVQDAKAWANLKTGAWCYYENKGENGTTYGKLYNLFAVVDPRGLAPNGYHIPTKAEWKILTDYLGGENEAADKMKSSTGWRFLNGSNSSGFSGLPGGARACDEIDRMFWGIGDRAQWWSSSNDYKSSMCCYIEENYVKYFQQYETFGFSVRCLKD